LSAAKSRKKRRATFLPATQGFAAPAFRPQLDDRASEVDLTVQLKRTCLNGNRA
jgi:hypothetical protein